MINKEKLGLFIVMSSLLFFIIKLHKKHFEQFRLLNCDLSKADTSLSDQDFLCCQAKNFLEEHNEEDGHPSYSHYNNVWDQCNKISTIDVSHDKYMMSDRNAYYDSLEVQYNNLVEEYDLTLNSYSNLDSNLRDLENTYNTEYAEYNEKLSEFERKSDQHADLISINSNLIEMSEMHEYKLALQSLDDVINKQVQTEMGVSMDMGLKHKENHIRTQIKTSLQNSLDYIPKLTDLYMHNVRLFESIQKTKGLAINETHEETGQLLANISSSESLYANSITLLNKSETTLYSISQSIKELSNYLYQTRDVDQTLETISNRDITVTYMGQDITLIFRDGKYILPENISTVNMKGAEYISEFLFKQCSIHPTTRVATCEKLPIAGTKALEEDITQEYKKQPINDEDEDNPLSSTLSSTFFSTFLRYMERELIMNNSISNTETDLDKTFAYAFLLKTFSDTTGTHSPSVDASSTEEGASS